MLKIFIWTTLTLITAHLPAATYTLTNSSELDFADNETASQDIITTKNGSSVNFSGNSTAEDSTIIMDASILNFYDSSTASNALITLHNSSEVSFNDSATAAASTINAADNSTVIFYNADINDAVIDLSSGATLSCSGDAIIGSVIGDSSGQIALNNASISVGNNNSSTTFAGNITNCGCFVSISKVGNGIWTLTGDNSDYMDPVAIYAGGITLNGSIGSSISVIGGTLSGTGTLGGDLVVTGGAVSPGNTIGTLIVLGNYAPGPSAVYRVHVNGLGESSMLNISGTALLDGTVEVVSVDGTYDFEATYTIMEATTRDDFFTGISSPDPAVSYFLIYDSTHVYLRIQPKQIPYSPKF